MNPTLKVKCLVPGFPVPAYQTPGAAGLDLHAAETLWIAPGERRTVRTGIAVEIPDGYEGQLRPRSGLASRDGIVAILGTIDSDYRGEVGAILENRSSVSYRVEWGSRIAQLVIAPVARCEVVEVEALTETERGAGGFGSTGR
jgi:dUTP pyrophosphatase